MPHRRPKPSLILGAVAAIAVASPFAAYSLENSTSGVRTTSESSAASIPAEMAEVLLAAAPDIVIPVKQLTGIDLPDLHLSDLKKLPLPHSIPVPYGIPTPPGVTLPETIQLPDFSANPGDIAAPSAAPLAPSTPVTPGMLPPVIADQLGATVKQVSQSKPFSMVALTANSLAGADASVRAKQPDGSWGPWMSTDKIETNRTGTAPSGKAGTEPLFVGETNTVQILVTHKHPAGAVMPAPAPAATPPATGHATGGPATGNDISAALIQPGYSPTDATLSDIAQPLPNGGPRVITRPQWGADEGLRCSNPTDNDSVGGATVHHTAGSNNYTKAESAGIVRAIYKYEAKTLGWCDIGYNALIDKYGQIFEGRFGGLDKAVGRAHAGGFNENTVGVALLGDFDKVAPTQAQLEAAGKYIGWQLKLAKLDPEGHTTMWSGDGLYTKLDEIRAIAEKAVADAAAPAKATPTTTAPLAKPGQDLRELANAILTVTDTSPIAQKWASTGGPAGPMGAALTGVLPAAGGQHYAKFVNGDMYTSPTGTVVTVVGKILQMFQQLGLDQGVLGLPVSSEHLIPGGMREDFERGSLIFNQATGFVSTILQTYNKAYYEAYNNPQDASAPGPVPPAASAPPPPPAR